MKSSATKTARFAVVVKESGPPEPVFLWTRPEHNPDFMSAIRHNRVMTVKQETKGSRKDFGVVGFRPERNVSYLIFPKSLKRFKDQRIVGLNYDLIKNPGPIGRAIKPVHETKLRFGRVNQSTPFFERGRGSEQGPSKHEKRFRITVRFTSVTEVERELEAASVATAREKALETFQAPDLSRGTVTKKVIRTETVG